MREKKYLTCWINKVFRIISRIKQRSKKKNVLNEISKDMGKTDLEPDDLILIDYIDKKISKSLVF